MIPGFIDTSHTTCRDVFADLVSSSNWRFAFNMVQRFTSSNLGILVDFIHISSIPTCNYTVNTNLQTFTHNLPPAEAKTRERGVFWGPFTLSPRQRSPDPVRGASPPAPLLDAWMLVSF